mmetsp:Transcript_26049/g.82695  ORF Transcript_26049/g.82695 Transcript_26049/m.82695 type:complete len:342 (-) Transcript_26049:1547-2572(-)
MSCWHLWYRRLVPKLHTELGPSARLRARAGLRPQGAPVTRGRGAAPDAARAAAALEEVVDDLRRLLRDGADVGAGRVEPGGVLPDHGDVRGALVDGGVARVLAVQPVENEAQVHWGVRRYLVEVVRVHLEVDGLAEEPVDLGVGEELLEDEGVALPPAPPRALRAALRPGHRAVGPRPRRADVADPGGAGAPAGGGAGRRRTLRAERPAVRSFSLLLRPPVSRAPSRRVLRLGRLALVRPQLLRLRRLLRVPALRLRRRLLRLALLVLLLLLLPCLLLMRPLLRLLLLRRLLPRPLLRWLLCLRRLRRLALRPLLRGLRRLLLLLLLELGLLLSLARGRQR